MKSARHNRRGSPWVIQGLLTAIFAWYATVGAAFAMDLTVNTWDSANPGVDAVYGAWRVSDGPNPNTWYPHGASQTISVSGTYTVVFGDVPGFTKPGNLSVVVDAAVPQTVSGIFTAVASSTPVFGETGSGQALTVNLSPAGAVTAGARWMLNDPLGAEQTSGGSVTLATGASYSIYFKSIAGYKTPSVVTGTVASSPITVSAKYGYPKLDFNGDGKSDVLFRHSTGPVYFWHMNGKTVSNGGYASSDPGSGASPGNIVGVGDFDGNGVADLLFENTTSTGANKDLYLWIMKGTNNEVSATVTIDVNANGGFSGTPRADNEKTWGVGDFNGDGDDDILLVNTSDGSGNVAVRVVFIANGAFSAVTASATTISTSGANAALAYVAGDATPDPDTAPKGWRVATVADFDADGKADILWRLANQSDVTIGSTTYKAGRTSIWYMNGADRASGGELPAHLYQYQSTEGALSPFGWSVQSTGDFNGDGYTDILYRYSGSVSQFSTVSVGTMAVWTLKGEGSDNKPVFHTDVNGTETRGLVINEAGTATMNVGAFTPTTGWHVTATGDYNGDGNDDVLFRYQGTGHTYMWFMDGRKVKSSPAPGFTDTYAGAVATWITQVMRTVPEAQ